MTIHITPDSDFEAIALAFLDERDRQPGQVLKRYLTNYPQFARELTLLAVETAAAEGLPAAPAAPPARLHAQLRSDARAAFQTGTPELHGLLAQGRTLGLTPRTLAARLEIGVDVLALLEERLVRVDTIVPSFLQRVAALLQTSSAAVQAYLALPPATAARGVAYHAPRGHALARMLSFEEAIHASNLMTAEQKAHWLGAGPGTVPASE